MANRAGAGVSKLPSALARWHRQLQLFPEDVAAQLGRLVQRLAPAFDSIESSQADPIGDVDGFDGITSRGSYERLLASEWALHKAAPLEFLRRAAGGEHSFLQLARREPAQRESTLAWFDAGPDQLGGCRIVQLALLVLLVQRAESRKQQLFWQLLHQLDEPPLVGLDEHTVRAFLSGRTGLRASERFFATDFGHYADHRLWLIGARSVLAAAPAESTRVALSEQVSASAQLVDVRMECAARRREITLELPESALAARLLRDPFERARPRVVRGALPASNLILNPQASRLYYRDARGDLISQPIPNSPRAPAGNSRRYPGSAQHAIASVTGRGKKTVWLSHARGSLALGFADNSEHGRPLSCHGPLLDPPRALTPFAWFPGERMAVFEASDRSLWRADFRTQTARAIAEGVQGWLLQRDHYLVAVDRWLERNDSGGGRVLELKPFWASSFTERALPWHEAKLAAGYDQAQSCTLGVSDRGIWQLQEWTWASGTPSMKRLTSIQPAASDVVLGIEAFSEQRARPGLWVLDDQRREVRIVSSDASQHSVVTAGAAIEEVALASMASVLAFTTAQRELFVVDARGTVLHRGSMASS